MINRLKYATISDIGIYQLIFFDNQKSSELANFCDINGISYLPAKDRKSIYKLTQDGFKKEVLTEQICMNPYDRIFEENTLKKFERLNPNEVFFITENETIRGVVHIIDYNSEFIQVELYRALFRFESNLRYLLVKSGLNNADFLVWVKEKAENEKDKNNKKHWLQRLEDILPSESNKLKKVEEKRNELNPFQSFYLFELMRFASDKNLIDKRTVNVDKISKLRNQIAHSIDLTTQSTEEGRPIYNYKKLKIYIDHINAFFIAYDFLQYQIENVT